MRSRLKCAAVLAAVLIAGCGRSARERAATAVTGGDPQTGTSAIGRYGCGSCHTIPGITGANALVGPQLAGIRLRTYIAGDLPNNTENLMHWVQHPLSVHPNSAMPELGVTTDDARNIAAFLYSLK
jgi:cytochrome c1